MIDPYVVMIVGGFFGVVAWSLVWWDRRPLPRRRSHAISTRHRRA